VSLMRGLLYEVVLWGWLPYVLTNLFSPGGDDPGCGRESTGRREGGPFLPDLIFVKAVCSPMAIRGVGRSAKRAERSGPAFAGPMGEAAGGGKAKNWAVPGFPACKLTKMRAVDGIFRGTGLGD
jgi:hypothetical protein